ncbi:cytochrome C assembly protein [Pueribacillus theae]|uniref:Cytochrome C assembly protein n=1 Tax=Pueribacillus theae TaxID=2171751 RepID=A0A2U1JMK9_9BACI|nr:cytochrome c biogenesis protein CcsA [Pueribacillus theae]PWA06400.1 cytochrome C assembly protein [Pueribacillus theae]
MIDWIYEITIILYAISLLGYFIDFLQNNRKANRFAFWLLSIVWALQTLIFVVYFFDLNRYPILTPFEGFYFVTWMIITLSLIINWFSRIDFFVFFANMIGFLMMSLHFFSPKSELSPLITATLTTELFLMHIAMAFLSYAAFTLSFVFAVMYVIQYEMLKNKKSIKRLGRFGSLTELERMSFFFAMVGVPLLSLSIIWGGIWGHLTIDQFNYLDAKVITSIMVVIGYCFFLYAKVVKNTQGKSLSFINIVAFLLLLINIFLSRSFSEFHWW